MFLETCKYRNIQLNSSVRKHQANSCRPLEFLMQLEQPHPGSECTEASTTRGPPSSLKERFGGSADAAATSACSRARAALCLHPPGLGALATQPAPEPIITQCRMRCRDDSHHSYLESRRGVGSMSENLFSVTRELTQLREGILNHT